MRSSFRSLFVLLSLSVVFLTACGSSSNTPPVSSLPPDVYAVGFETVGTLYKAVIWKNGVLTVLNSGNYGARAFAVTVANGHVYVAGFAGSGSGKDVAMLWVDGVPTMLTDGTGIGVAYGVAVSGTDVYVVGYESTISPTFGIYVTAAKYWKNGVQTVLNNGIQGTGQSALPEGATANAITTDGTDIYIAGEVYTQTQIGPNTFTSEPVVTYWKNGVPTSLTSGLELADTTGISVSGGHVNVSGGLCVTFTPDCLQAELWTDSNAAVLAPGLQSEATGVAVSGLNTYTSINITASGGNVAYLSTNGNLTALSYDNQSAANCVVTEGSDVYVGGGDIYGPAYWRNGTLTYLSGSMGTASVYAMTVVPSQT